MAERLAFNLWGAGRTLRGSVGWVKAPESGTLPDAAATVPAADREAELGLLGRLRFHGAALLPAAGHGARARRRSTCPSSSPSARSSPWSRTGSERQLPLVRLSPETIVVAFMAFVMLATVPVLGLARRRPRHVHRRLLQGRARLPADGQLRQEREGAASAVVADSLRHGLRRGARRARLRQRHATSSKASGSTDRSRA